MFRGSFETLNVHNDRRVFAEHVGEVRGRELGWDPWETNGRLHRKFLPLVNDFALEGLQVVVTELVAWPHFEV